MPVCIEGQDKLIMEEGRFFAEEKFFELLKFMGSLNK